MLSGNVRLIVIGRIPASSSLSAMSIGPVKVCWESMSIGAPIDICRALAPTTRAFSKRVSFGGPTVILFCSDVF